MQFIIFIFMYPILWCVSILPFRLLYILSDFVFLIVYYVIGYRKEIVRYNINLTLTHLSIEERLSVEKKFYKHLCDLFLEMIKTMSMSSEEINNRFVIKNPIVLKNIEEENKSIAMMIGHYASYEWAISLNNHTHYKAYAIYKKIANPYFDKLVHKIRSKFKAHLITTKETIPVIAANKKNNQLSLYGFASDQSPRLTSTFHWQKFMGIEVPVHTGAEMLSKKYNMSIVFLKINKIKRGFYEGSLEVLSDNATSSKDYEITDKFLKLVEQQIYEAPEFYLWTHNRWKHKR